MTHLRFENVTVGFGHGARAVRAVDDITLSVGSGEVLGLVGESGSGKSTLARAAVGLVEPTGGRILLGDHEVSHARGALARERLRMQMVFQDPHSCLDPRRTIGDSLQEALTAARVRKQRARTGRGADRTEASRLLDLVALPAHFAQRLPRELSGGQRQRVAIARAIGAEPDVILADEITSALDVSVQGAVLNLLRDLQRELGFSMMFISHNLAVVRLVSDRVAVLKSGRLVEEGPVLEVLEAPREGYTRQLIAAIPTL